MSARKLYKALHRAIRVRDHYQNLMDSAYEAGNGRAERYAKDMHKLYVKKVHHLSCYMPYAAQQLEHATSYRDDPYYDWGWLYRQLPMYEASGLLRENNVHQRDYWTREHPMPHNEPQAVR